MQKEKTPGMDESLSVCEVLRNDTSEVLRSMESQAPLMFQNFSNLYSQYLHMLDDVYGTCFIAEKRLFDELNLDPKMSEQLKKSSEMIKNIFLQNIENSSKFFDGYAKMRIMYMKSFDNYVHEMMALYFNSLYRPS